STVRCRDTSASPDGFPPRTACRKNVQARFSGSLRAHTSRRAAALAPYQRRRGNDSTRTIRGARRIRSLPRAPPRYAPSLRRGRAAEEPEGSAAAVASVARSPFHLARRLAELPPWIRFSARLRRPAPSMAPTDFAERF